MNLEVWNHIHDLLSRRNICIASNNEKQALVPSGAIVLHNEVGTAPGLILEHGEKTFIMLPGPPFELKHVCEKELFPYFEQRFPHLGIIKSHTLKLLGIGESNLAEKLDDLIVHQSNPTIALYARRGELLVRLTAKASSEEEADTLIADMQEQVEKIVGTYVYGYDNDTLPEVLGKELLSLQQTIAFAESCTGGLASSMMTDVPGSSEYVKGSVISYTDEIKNQVIHVSKTTLAKKGAVSEETALEMAKGAREVIGSDMAVSITGLAGPGGGTRKKPVGLVYIAVADAKGEVCRKFNFGGTRTQIKYRAAMAALGFALDRLKESSQTNAEEVIHDHDAER
jgi:nicotinamide-nucleotide amidase